MEWSDYWTNFISLNKLKNKVIEMDEIDITLFGACRIERICREIYYDYQKYSKELEKKRQDFLEIIENFPEVHLQTSRVKKVDSLLKKVIEKRYGHLLDSSSQYAAITGKNYKDILTDLIGIRLIVNYRGKWTALHEEILKEFPYVEDKTLYQKHKFIPHMPDGKRCIAEIPKAYYAYGDDISVFKTMNVETYLRENGYRSVHYIVSFMETYMELQVRTIYDEAWSDCDHNCVYKHEDNASYAALLEMSKILNLLTNTANDLGEIMQEVYKEKSIRESGEKYSMKQELNLQVDKIFDKMANAEELLKEFQSKIEK